MAAAAVPLPLMDVGLFSPVFPLVTLGMALLTGRLLLRWVEVPAAAGRFATIDGLRGYLAFAVFLHHASIWWGYLRSGRWELPASPLFVHFGQSAVALFFMITGFLFFGKLLDARERRVGIDWLRLLVSRLLRLYPLYLIVMAALLVIVAVLSDGQLQVSGKYFLRTLAHWLLFTVFDAPALNQVAETSQIVAGVVWSLPYEWFFYLSLPCLALAMRLAVPWRWALASALAVAVFSQTSWLSIHLWAFGVGMLAAWAARRLLWRAWAPRWPASLLAIAALVLVVGLTPGARELPAIGLLGLAFAVIAAGNSLFGLLHWRVSRLLGEMAYSLYLLHGLLLFVSWRFLVDASWARHLTPAGHWAVIWALTPVLIGLGALSFRWIEQPAMARVDALTAALRRRGRARLTA